ncbi:hypothetical protein Tco_0242692 [Tanacetum coccineum]
MDHSGIDSEEVAKVLDIIKVSGPCLGLELNIKKTEKFWPSYNGMKLSEGLFPVDIRRPSSGVKLLGGAVSRDAHFISGLAMKRAVNAVDLISLLPQLHPADGICGMDDDYISTLDYLCDTISSFDFSGFTNMDTAPSKAQQTLANVLFSEMVKDMEVNFDITMRQKAVFECLHATHTQDFLLDILIDGLVQHMHAWIPLENMRFIVKRSRDSSTDTIWLETSFLTHVGVGGKHTCVDLTRVSPLVGLSSPGFTVGRAALKVASLWHPVKI